MIVLFDENETIAYRLKNILKEKYSDVAVYTNLLCFLESFYYYNDDIMNIIFIISNNVLSNRSINVKDILKNFDCYAPILTYDISSDIFLKLEINYIYEYQRNNYKIYADDITKIRFCFDHFAHDKDYFSLYNFQCLEMPVFLSNNSKNQDISYLYGEININTKKEADIMSCLTKMQTKLFMFLLSHKEGGTLSDIEENLWGSSSKSKAQNVYSLIHGLKKIISQKTTNKYKLVCIKKKYQLIQITEILTDSNLCNTEDNIKDTSALV